MKPIIINKNTPAKDKACDICSGEIKAGTDCYYFIRDEKKEGKIVCKNCGNELCGFTPEEIKIVEQK